MKILYVTTVGGTMDFFKSLIKELIDTGNIVDIATNEELSKVPDCYRAWGCKIYPISTSRSPFSFGNIKAIKQIRCIARNYDIVHCHTPLAGMATRFACKKLRKKQGLKVIYTAHGFHFYKGSSVLNWLVYYPIEKLCSRWTDALITINREDYELAKKRMRAGKIEHITGVGVDIERFASIIIDKDEKRDELGIPKDAYLILSVGELNKNKNHKVVIDAIGRTPIQNIYYAIAGQGHNAAFLKKYSQRLGVRLVLLGLRTDVAELYKTSDLYIHPSLREGLPVALMEAIASGTPCLASNIRGCNDLLDESYLFNPKSVNDVRNKIMNHNQIGNQHDISRYDKEIVNKSMIDLYYDVAEVGRNNGKKAEE